VDSVSDDGTWIWTSIDPDTKMIPAFHIGKRYKDDAFTMIDKIRRKLENTPLFISDGLQFYKAALLKMYGIKKKHKNPFDGRLRQNDTKLIPPEGLRYGQLIKTTEGRKLLNVEKRVIFGDVKKSEITTSMIERLNLTLRQEINRFSRKTIGPSKNINHLTSHFSFYVRYYNFCRPHMAHKIEGIKYGTPAMAAGVTDDVWSIKKLIHFPYRNYIN
jgi:IS1 family transposase